MNIIQFISVKARKYRYRLRAFAYMALSILFVLSILSILTYHWASNIITKQLENESIKYINQIAVSIETIAGQIKAGFRQFYEQKSVSDFSRYPLGAYYENIDIAQANENEITNHYLYVKDKQNTIESMQTLKNFNSYIMNVEFVDSNKGIVFQDNWRQYSTDTFEDIDLIKMIQSIYGYESLVVGPRNVSIDGETYGNVLSIIYSLGNNCNIVVNINFEKLLQSIIGKIGNNIDSTLAVVGQNGEIVYTNNADFMKSKDLWDMDGGIYSRNETSFPLKSQDYNLFCVMQGMDDINCRIVGIYDMDVFLKSINDVRNVILVAVVILFIYFVMIMFITSNSLYKPVKRLLQYMAGKEKRYADTKDEFSIVYERFNDLEMKRKHLEQRLNESFPVYRERFFSSFLSSNRYSDKELKDKLSFFEIGLDGKKQIMLVIALETSISNGNNSIRSDEMAYTVLTGILDSMFKDRKEYIHTQTDEGFLAVSIEYDEPNPLEIYDIAQRIAYHIEDLSETLCYIVISRSCNCFSELPELYREGVMAFKYRNITQDSKVTYVDDLVFRHEKKVAYPKDKLDMLCGYIIQGDGENAASLYDAMIEDTFSKSGLVADDMQKYMLWIYTGIVEAINRIGADSTLSEKDHILDEILHTIGFNDEISKFRQHINTISDRIREKITWKDHSYMEKLMQIINTTDERDLSLEYLASRIKVSPAYLSRIFKEKTGTKFIDYITEYRINKAKKLLQETNMQVQDIASAVGYYKSNHFIKVFKKALGVTPAEYRKIKLI